MPKVSAGSIWRHFVEREGCGAGVARAAEHSAWSLARRTRQSDSLHGSPAGARQLRTLSRCGGGRRGSADRTDRQSTRSGDLTAAVAGEGRSGNSTRTAPAATMGVPLDTAREHGAVQLFERLALAADRRFTLTGGEHRRWSSTCATASMACHWPSRWPRHGRHCSGLARLREQLDDRFAILRAQERDAPPRQKSLRLTLDWSHSLLGDDEKLLLRRLSAYVGSFCIEGAQHCAVDAVSDASVVLEHLKVWSIARWLRSSNWSLRVIGCWRRRGRMRASNW